MKIKKVEIENFKSIKKAFFILDNFLCFVGENSQGKSNILKAIKVFLKNETPDVEDLYVLDDEKSDFSKITLTFNKIKQQTREKLVETFGNDIFNIHEEFILSYLIEKDSEQNKVKTPYYSILSSIEEIKVAPKKKTPLLEVFPELHFAQALCNITEETKANNKSLFSKVANIIREKQQDKETEELIEAFQKYRKKVEDTTGQTISSLSEVQDGLEEFLAEWGATAEVRIKLPEISQILKENLIININDGVTTPAEDKGHGFQRSLLFALLRLLAKLNKANPENVREHIFIFEEPEMYLHPQMCKATYKTFKELSQSNQVLISTHSSHFIDLKDYNGIAIVRKNRVQGTQLTQVLDTLVPQEDTNSAKYEFDMANFFNPDRNELFFAKKVILVEGQTEKTALPLLAEKLSLDTTGVSIIDCNGKNNIYYFSQILGAFGLNYYVIIDEDDPSKLQEAYNALEAKYANVLESFKTLPDFIEDAYSDLEDIIQNHKNIKKGQLDKSQKTFDQNDIIKQQCETDNAGFHICSDKFEDTLGINLKSPKPYNAYKKIINASYLIPDELSLLVKNIYSINSVRDNKTLVKIT